MALTPEEEQELAAIEGELQQRQAQPQQAQQALPSGLTQEEEFELAQIEQELAIRQAQPEPKVMPRKEADLGFINRARYAIEPLESNRMALLMEQFGEENVQQDKDGNIYLKQGNEFRPVNKEGFSVADVADFAGASPEMVGGLVGMGAGAVGGGGVASIPAAMGLGAAGGALGSAARQGLSGLLGTPQVATVGERVSETGMSAGIAGLFGGAGQGLKMAAPSIKKGARATLGVFKRGAEKIPGVKTAGEVFESTAKSTKGVIDALNKTFSFKRAEDADELFQIADKLGVDKSLLPEAVEFGENSMVSRTARTIAEGPLGEEKLIRFQQAQNQIANALDNQISSISPTGSTMTRDEAGQFIVDSVNDATKDFFGNLDETFSSMVKGSPGLKMSEDSQKKISSRLLGLERLAKGELKRGIGSQKQEGKSLLEAVQAIRAGNGSFKQTTEAMQRIGREAFKKGNQNRLPVDQKNLQKLYFDIQEEVIKNVRQVYGDDAAEGLIRNNKMITDFIGESGVLSKVLGKDMAPEKVFSSLVENGDTKKVEALMSVLPPEKVQSLKASFLDSIVKRNADGEILFDSTVKNLDKKKEVISKLFSPDELQGVADVLRLGKRMGKPVMSSSGTGASNSFNSLLNSAKEAVFNENSLEVMKKRGRSRPKFIRSTSSKRPNRKFKRLKPSQIGSGGNVLLDSSQREGAYFVRGPAGNKKENKK